MIPYIPIILAFLISFLLCPIFIRLAPRIGLMDHPNLPRKKHPHPIPLVGGVVIWIAVTATTIHLNCHIWVLTTGMGIVGLIDDYLDLSPLKKFLGQLVIGGCLLYFFILESPPVPWYWLNLFLTVVWFIGITNAFNYTDNSNGLCAGLGMISLGGISFMAVKSGNPGSQTYSLLWISAMAGFLLWNFPKARMFLGDSGSHLIGAIVAMMTLSLYWDRIGQQNFLFTVLPSLSLVAVPLIDFIQVSLGRIRRGQSIWHGDNFHLAHLLIKSGRSPAQAVIILWGVAICGVALAILITRL